MYQGGAAWRSRLDGRDQAIKGRYRLLLSRRSDDELARLMANLGGHCLPSILETFESIDHDRPVAFLGLHGQGLGARPLPAIRTIMPA